jgi:hypothetical protein
MRLHQIDRPLRYGCARRARAFGQGLGVIVWLYLQQSLYQQKLQIPHRQLVVEPSYRDVNIG